jgi:hypothetical protein
MEIGIEINRPLAKVLNYITQPQKMPFWTSHQTIIKQKSRYFEIRLHNTLELIIESNKINDENYSVTYNWVKEDYHYKVELFIKAVSKKITWVYVDEMALNKEYIPSFQAELRLLKSILEHSNYTEKKEDSFKINSNHLILYTRL